MSPNDQLLATGSSVGTVNIYKLPISSNNPTPIKTVMNLVTSITILKFNASSEILAMASGDKPNALKLVSTYLRTKNFTATASLLNISCQPGKKGKFKKDW